LKNKVEVIYCDCFQTFVERENSVGKDTNRFLTEILFGVSSVWNVYRALYVMPKLWLYKVKFISTLLLQKFFKKGDACNGKI